MSKRSGYKKFLGLVAAIGLSVLGAAKAQAGYTQINAPAKGEASQAEIFSHTYGGTFTANGVNYSNGSIQALRIDDNWDGLMPFDILSAKAIASFASYKQNFGYGTVGNEHELFAVKGTGYNVSGSVGHVDLPFLTQLIRGGQGNTMSSLASANVDGADHMVTYLLLEEEIRPSLQSQGEVKGGFPTLTFVTFFEDKSVKQHGDFDFNDLAVEIKVGCPAVVPLPAAAWSGLATLAGGVVVTGYRKARRQMA